MRRGSSKETAPESPRAAPGNLPLSAPPGRPTGIAVEFEIVRAGRSEIRRVEVEAGTPLRTALRLAGQAPEGSAVLNGDVPLPLDVPLSADSRLTVIPTFSGG
jgi:sulfur carrier protein ThiS